MADDFEIKIEWEGFDEVRQALRQATKEILAAATHAMVENAEDLLGRAMALAPIDEGTLRGSGSARVNRGGVAVTEMRTDESGGKTHIIKQIPGSDLGSMINLVGDNQIEAEDGFNTPYAARQHEEILWKHPQGGEAKYLEKPLKQQANDYARNIATAIKGEVTHGG